MRILEPSIELENGSATLRASVRMNRGDSFPQALWFSVPERFASLLTAGFEPFAVTLSSLASARRETIEIDGSFSETLSVGLREYWRIMSVWGPDKFAPLSLHATTYADMPRQGGVPAAAFSGGVDSFFTQYLNAERPNGFKPKYAVFVQGFDIPLTETAVFEAAAGAYEQALRPEGVELIAMRTNTRAFMPPGFWEMGHGSALAGVALALSSGINRFYIPSSKTYGTMEPWGTDPLTDGLLSSDRVDMIHDGAFYSRFDKISLMKDWQPFQQLIRTCYKKTAAFENCGQCQKCRRTMMVLEAFGVLPNFPTFPPIRGAVHFANCSWQTPHERLFGGQTIAHAMRERKFSLALAGMLSMRTSPLRKVLKQPKAISRRIRSTLRADKSSRSNVPA
jgi:hypothetical protein